MVDKSVPPGFRFHPTDAELVLYYLKRKIRGMLSQHLAVIAEVDLYKFAPWDLPEKSCLQSKDLEWYFFCPRNNKYSHGNRTNRATDIGYWKPTGQDRPVMNKKKTVGMRKTLIFHTGKSPNGTRTDWVMHEYRMEKSDELANAGFIEDAYVLCKVYEKSGQGPKTGEQYGAPFNEEDWEDEVDMNINNENYLPSAPVLNSEPLQSVAPQSGEQNTVHNAFDVQNSSLIQPSSIGAKTSLQEHFEVGETSTAQISFRPGELSTKQCHLPQPFSDGIFFGQLEAILHSSPPHGNSNLVPEMTGLANPLHNSIHDTDLDYSSGVRDDLDTSTHHLMGPDDGFTLSELFNNIDNQELQPSFAEYADGHYMTLDDIASENQVNHMEQPPPLPIVQNLPNATFGNDYYDEFVNSLLIHDPQHIETSNVLFPCIAYPNCPCCNSL